MTGVFVVGLADESKIEGPGLVATGFITYYYGVMNKPGTVNGFFSGTVYYTLVFVGLAFVVYTPWEPAFVAPTKGGKQTFDNLAIGLA